jgi:Fur family zinc uptake transcriptional regulator
MADAFAEAERLARERHLRLTPLRRRVLEILLGSHRPIGAYEVLAELAADGTRPAPPTVYRALEFLMTSGFVHRIDTRNAYIACFRPARRHRTHFLICRGCGAVSEIEDPALQGALAEATARAGFAVERETVEIAGLCAACAKPLPLQRA